MGFSSLEAGSRQDHFPLDGIVRYEHIIAMNWEAGGIYPREATAIPEALPGFRSKNPVPSSASALRCAQKSKLPLPSLPHPSPAQEVAAGVKITVLTHSSVSFLLSSMNAMDSDLRRFVTSYVRRVTPKISSWYRLSSWETGWQRGKMGFVEGWCRPQQGPAWWGGTKGTGEDLGSVRSGTEGRE